MDAWRTSCPRLTIWEDVVDHGFVVRRRDPARGPMVELTSVGRAVLHMERPAVVLWKTPLR